MDIITEEKSYASFGLRFVALCLDILITLPLGVMYIIGGGFGLYIDISLCILSSILSSMYFIFLHARYGVTLGKFIIGIRVTKPDGSIIGWLESFKRYSILLIFTIAFLFIDIFTLLQIDYNHYLSLDIWDRSSFIYDYMPMWNNILTLLFILWLLVSFIVLLINNKNRTLHDMIANTIVIDIKKRHISDSKTNILDSGFSYPGFFRRLAARCLDLLTIMPIGLFFIIVEDYNNIILTVTTLSLLSILLPLYFIFFNVYAGGTPGKLAFNMKITKMDGSKVTYLDSFKRTFIDSLVIFSFYVIRVWVTISFNSEYYLSLAPFARSELVDDKMDIWFGVALLLCIFWILASIIVLFTNKQRQTIHDFIANTVVIKKKT